MFNISDSLIWAEMVSCWTGTFFLEILFDGRISPIVTLTKTFTMIQSFETWFVPEIMISESIVRNVKKL